MNRYFPKWLGVLAVCVLFCGCVNVKVDEPLFDAGIDSPPPSQIADSTPGDGQNGGSADCGKKLNDCRKQLNKLDRALKKQTEDTADYAAEIRKLKKRIDRLEDENEELRDKLDD